jgi:hypothetical protein
MTNKTLFLLSILNFILEVRTKVRTSTLKVILNLNVRTLLIYIFVQEYNKFKIVGYDFLVQFKKRVLLIYIFIFLCGCKLTNLCTCVCEIILF